MTDYKKIRQALHQHPQTAGKEEYAHDTIVNHLSTLHPDRVHQHVGGYGVLAYWGRDLQQPTVLLRADIDALPIGHRCGHDGHATILMRVAEMIDGKFQNVLLLWQPAEETGEGARAVLQSGVLGEYNIKAVFGLHNIPSYEEGTVLLSEGTFAAASTGICYTLIGRQTHASTPELGLNPGLATAEIISAFSRLNSNEKHPFRQSTLICVRLGEEAFGTSAGRAELMFTLRAFTNKDMQELLQEADERVGEIAAKAGLEWSRTLHEPFRATENTPRMTRTVRAAAEKRGMMVVEMQRPQRWSEDFAEYLAVYDGAFFGVGSGKDQPELHHPDYVFPDAIIEPAAELLVGTVEEWQADGC